MCKTKRQEFQEYANESNTKNENLEATESDLLQMQAEQIAELQKRLQ